MKGRAGVGCSRLDVECVRVEQMRGGAGEGGGREEVGGEAKEA